MPDASSERQIVRELFILSCLSLFFELLIIRWMSSDMRAFTVFRTFPLITCFVGLGVGFALRRDDSYRLFIPATLVFAVSMAACNFTGICFWGFPSFGNFQWQNLVGLMSHPGWPYVITFALFVVLLLMGPFAMNAAIGSRLGVLFNQLAPLRAYSCNVFGAVVGSVLLPIISFFGCPPWVLLLIGSAAIVYLQRQSVSRMQNCVHIGLLIALVPLLMLLPEQHAKPLLQQLVDLTDTHHTVLWSPYQRLDLATFYEKPDQKAGTGNGAGAQIDDKQKRANATAGSESLEEPFIGLEIGANRAFYQYFFSKYALNSSKLSQTSLLQNIKNEYNLPFTLNNPKNALIVGAGTGQNVSSAVEAGLTDVDAVEIDPKILDIGRQFNPDYHLPQVHLVCDDARHYFVNCQKKYDVIDFSTLDSHAVSGLGSSVRVDMYVYTAESMASALRLLSDNGILICSFATEAPWTKDRLYATLERAAGYPPLCLHGKFLATIYVLGKAVKDGSMAANPALHDYPQDKAPNGGGRILNDDWPYLYVRTDVVDYPYLLVVAEVIALSVFAARRFLFSNRDLLNWQMFFLGAAFMLLELHAITFLSLLYGATWLTSAIVITGILLMILVANTLVLKFNDFFSKNTHISYIGLLCAVILNYVVPAEQMLSMGAIGHVLATSMAVLPLAFAAFVFANAFKEAKNISGALAFNLFGAVIGGLLEYFSSYTGIKSVLIVSFLLYGCSMLCWFQRKPDGSLSEPAAPNVT
ncbi:MAG TPA: hypothetical protein V6C69_06075 [Trichormus sp.]